MRKPILIGSAVAAALLGTPVLAADTLYARVDMVRQGGEWRLGEIELTEPSLYLLHGDGAGENFARAISERL